MPNSRPLIFLRKHAALARLFALAALSVVAATWYAPAAIPQALQPDLVLRHGKVLTVDRSFRVAEAVAIMGERIVAVGSDADIGRLVGPHTRVIDLHGRTVIPGLIDSHIHTIVGAENELTVSLEKAASLKDVQAAFASRAAQTAPGKWIVGGSGWHESQLAEGRLPVREELDAVTPNNPVFIKRGGHVGIANSAALKLAGITKDTPDPKGGVIVRDKRTGESTGVLIEGSAFGLVQKLVPLPTRAEHVQGLKTFTAKLSALGVTSTIEPGIKREEIAAYMDLWRSGAMTTRVHILERIGSLEDVNDLSSFLAPNFGDDWLRIAGLKYLGDGGIEAGYMTDPYQIVEGEQNDADYHGKAMLPRGGMDELRTMFETAAQRGWQVQVHAVGDATITQMVNLMEEIDRKYPLRDLRWTIMHIFLPTPEALQKMKRMGLRATVQDHPVRLGYNMVRYWGEARAARAIPVRSIVTLGISTGGGTDAPVVNWNPFESMWWMVTRKIFANGQIRVLGPAETISREQALGLYTMGSADVAFAEDRVGSIESSKLADVVVLSDDFLTVPEDKIRDIRPVLTLVGGKIVYQNGL